MKKTKKQKKLRGYLLLEVTIAGAIAAVAVVALLSMLGDARTKSISTARDMTSRGIVARGIEQVRGQQYPALVNVAATQVPGVTGRYTQEIRVVVGNETLFGTQSSEYKDVTVIVKHPSGNVIETDEATVRIYEP